VGASIWVSTLKFGGFGEKTNSSRTSIWTFIFHTPPNSHSHPPFLEALHPPLQTWVPPLFFSPPLLLSVSPRGSRALRRQPHGMLAPRAASPRPPAERAREEGRQRHRGDVARGGGLHPVAATVGARGRAPRQPSRPRARGSSTPPSLPRRTPSAPPPAHSMLAVEKNEAATLSYQ
jgi:hypothetical protein